MGKCTLGKDIPGLGTQDATVNNDEVLVVLNNSQVAQDFAIQFVRMWNDNKEFKIY